MSYVYYSTSVKKRLESWEGPMIDCVFVNSLRLCFKKYIGALEELLTILFSSRTSSCLPTIYLCMYVWLSHIAEYGSTG